jgi:hypothetical protein
MLNGLALRNGFEAAPKVRKNRFECKIPGFKCNRSAVKGRNFVENKHRSFRDLSAA